MTTPRTIAVLRTDRLGDMVLTLPMFPALRSRFPDARLILIASRYVEPLVRSVNVIDEVVYLDAPDQNIEPILREHSVDTLFAPRPSLSEAWQALRSGVKRRIGSGFRWYSSLYNVRIHEHRSDAAYHEAEYNVRMIMHAFGGQMPKVELVSPRPGSAGRTHRERPRIIVHPGSGGSAKDWPAERFGITAHALHDELGAEIIITGIASERPLCEEVAAHCPDSTNLCGTLNLDGMIDLIADADVLMANSTGVLHVATAVSTPVVGFFPSTPSMSARRWGPYSEGAVVLESGPGDNMLMISVEAAVDAAKRLLTPA